MRAARRAAFLGARDSRLEAGLCSMHRLACDTGACNHCGCSSSAPPPQQQQTLNGGGRAGTVVSGQVVSGASAAAAKRHLLLLRGCAANSNCYCVAAQQSATGFCVLCIVRAAVKQVTQTTWCSYDPNEACSAQHFPPSSPRFSVHCRLPRGRCLEHAVLPPACDSASVCRKHRRLLIRCNAECLDHRRLCIIVQYKHHKPVLAQTSLSCAALLFAQHRTISIQQAARKWMEDGVCVGARLYPSHPLHHARLHAHSAEIDAVTAHRAPVAAVTAHHTPERRDRCAMTTQLSDRAG